MQGLLDQGEVCKVTILIGVVGGMITPKMKKGAPVMLHWNQLDLMAVVGQGVLLPLVQVEVGEVRGRPIVIIRTVVESL